MLNSKRVVLGAMAVLVGVSIAHAGKRLTTSSNGLGDKVECTVVNISDTKTITVDVMARTSNGSVAQMGHIVIPPGQRTFVPSTGGDTWCDFVVVSGGSAKDLRASMVVYEGVGVVAAIEPAREK